MAPVPWKYLFFSTLILSVIYLATHHEDVSSRLQSHGINVSALGHSQHSIPNRQKNT
jgi:hypothetical protein